MKKIFTLSVSALILATIFTISSCEKGPLVVTYDFGDKTIVVPANPYNTYQTFSFDVLHTDVMAALTAVGVADLTRVNTAKLKKMKALITTSGANFDKITGVWAYLKLPNATDDGILIGYADQDNLDSGMAEVDFKLTGSEIKQVLTEDMTLFVKVLSGVNGNDEFSMKLSQGAIEIETKK